MDIHPKISLVFVNYRSARFLKEALESLLSFEKERDLFEIIVVNNDTAENDVLSTMNQQFPFRLIQNNVNIGFGAGNNIGAQQANGDILGFINPDVLWTGEHLRHIGKLFDEKKELGILGMTLLDTGGKEEKWSAGETPSLKNLFRNNFFPKRNRSTKEQDTVSFDWVSGGTFFIRKNIFSLVSGFDEQFFLYFEDVDLCKRVRTLGFSVWKSVHHTLIHLGGQSKHSSSLQKKQFYVSQKKYFEKHRPVWENKILSFLHFFFCKRSSQV